MGNSLESRGVNWLVQALLAGIGAWRIGRMIAKEDGPGAVFLLWRNKLGEWRDAASAEFAHTQTPAAYRRLFNLSWLQDGFHCVLCLTFWAAGALTWAWGLPWRLWPTVAGIAVIIEKGLWHD